MWEHVMLIVAVPQMLSRNHDNWRCIMDRSEVPWCDISCQKANTHCSASTRSAQIFLGFVLTCREFLQLSVVPLPVFILWSMVLECGHRRVCACEWWGCLGLPVCIGGDWDSICHFDPQGGRKPVRVIVTLSGSLIHRKEIPLQLSLWGWLWPCQGVWSTGRKYHCS